MSEHIEPCLKCGSRERLLRVAASALTRLHDTGMRPHGCLYVDLEH